MATQCHNTVVENVKHALASLVTMLSNVSHHQAESIVRSNRIVAASKSKNLSESASSEDSQAQKTPAYTQKDQCRFGLAEAALAMILNSLKLTKKKMNDFPLSVLKTLNQAVVLYGARSEPMAQYPTKQIEHYSLHIPMTWLKKISIDGDGM